MENELMNEELNEVTEEVASDVECVSTEEIPSKGEMALAVTIGAAAIYGGYKFVTGLVIPGCKKAYGKVKSLLPKKVYAEEEDILTEEVTEVTIEEVNEEIPQKSKKTK